MRERDGALVDLLARLVLVEAPMRLLVRAIRPSADGPRRTSTAEADAALLEALRAEGIRVPLIVRPVDDWHGDDLYEVVDGHRRLAAARELGLETVPAIVLELNADQARTFRRTLD